MTARRAEEGAPQARCYVCAGNRLPGQPHCPAPPIPARFIERLLLRQLQRLDPAPEHFPAAWVALTPQQQIQSVQRRVARVDYNDHPDRYHGTLITTTRRKPLKSR
jgi:hypothetical protein